MPTPAPISPKTPRAAEAKGSGAVAQLRARGLQAKKSWGQNFCQDKRVLADICAAAQLHSNSNVIELGAGLGALTEPLLASGAPICAVERDFDMIAALKERFATHPDFTLLAADAQKLDYAKLSAEQGGPLTVLGNLPYHLAGRLMVSLADCAAQDPALIARAVFLVQWEVALRAAALPGSHAYGLLSVLLQRQFAVQLVRQVPPSAFFPQPKVQSAVIALQPRAAARPAADDVALVATARAAFACRRKTLRNALRRGLQQPEAVIDAALTQAELAPQRRAETLSLADYARLAAALQAAGCPFVAPKELPL